MSIFINAVLYDGLTSKEDEVQIEFTIERRVIIVSHGIDIALEGLEIESRLANTPRVLDFPNGIRCKSRENKNIDKVLKKYGLSRSKAYKIESSWRLTFASLFVTVGFIWFLLTTGSTYVSNTLASVLPQNTLDEMSKLTLAKMDEEYLHVSKLSARQEKRIQNNFDKLTNDKKRYTLHFRSAPTIGPNAFALPSGDMVLTDQLVALSQDDEFRDILGVLAHEKGHVVKQHSLRMAIKTGMAGAIIGYITGDISLLATTIPTVLINSSYSREFEYEADVYAINELKRLNISPKYVAELFEVLEKENENNDQNTTLMNLFASHPLTEDRIKFFNSHIKN